MGLPFARQVPEKNKPEFEIPAQGAGPGVGPAEGCWGREATNSTPDPDA